MTQIPAGWYPDPDPNQPVPGSQRYWDGQQWTEHVHAPEAQQSQQPTAAPPVGYGDTAGGYGQMPAGYGQMPGGYAAAPSTRATTPDGQALAGWWHRVGAYLIDSVILSPIVIVLALPWLRDIASAYGDLIGDSLDSARTGGPAPDETALVAELAVPFIVVTLIGLAVNFVYNVGFLKWKAGTPGKLITGLRVRLRDVPGPLSWSTVLRRWFGQNWYALVSFVPILGSLLTLYPLLDVLWPLWDSKKQAIHDKIARTNVVRVRG